MREPSSPAEMPSRGSIPLESLARPLECLDEPAEAEGDLGAQGQKRPPVSRRDPAPLGLGDPVRLGVATSREERTNGTEDRIAGPGGVEGEEHGVFRGTFLR